MITCPKCGNAHGPAILGHQEWGVYDGVLWWECLSCRWAWLRAGFDGRRAEIGQRCVDEHNRKGEES